MEWIILLFLDFMLEAKLARGSDLDFVMDDGELKGLQYVSLVLDLEDEFNCHVDVVSKKSSNKEFLNKIKDDEVLLYEKN